MGIDLLWIIMIPHSIWGFFLSGKLYLVFADIENEAIRLIFINLPLLINLIAQIKSQLINS